MEDFFIIWSIITTLFYGLVFFMAGNGLKRGLSIVNPTVVYNAIQVNYFGAYFVSLIHTICVGPLLTASYWLYKLCVIGRK